MGFLKNKVVGNEIKHSYKLSRAFFRTGSSLPAARAARPSARDGGELPSPVAR